MNLPHEDDFLSLSWLRWQRSENGGLVSRPIERPGGAAWLKSKLTALEIEADTIPCAGGEGAKVVNISAPQLAAFCIRNSGGKSAQLELIKTLKLYPLLVHGIAR